MKGLVDSSEQFLVEAVDCKKTIMMANTKRTEFLDSWKRGVTQYNNLIKKSSNMAEDYTVWCYERKKERQEFLKDFGDLPKMINGLIITTNKVFCQNKKSLLFCLLNFFEKQRMILRRLIIDVERKLSISGTINNDDKPTDLKKFLLKRKSTFHVTEIQGNEKDSETDNSSDSEDSDKEALNRADLEIDSGNDYIKVKHFK